MVGIYWGKCGKANSVSGGGEGDRLGGGGFRSNE